MQLLKTGKVPYRPSEKKALMPAEQAVAMTWCSISHEMKYCLGTDLTPSKKVASAWAEYEQTKEGVKYLAYLTPQIMNVKAM